MLLGLVLLGAAGCAKAPTISATLADPRIEPEATDQQGNFNDAVQCVQSVPGLSVAVPGPADPDEVQVTAGPIYTAGFPCRALRAVEGDSGWD